MSLTYCLHIVIIIPSEVHRSAILSEEGANCACILLLIAGRDIETKEATVFGVGRRKRHVEAVVCGGGKLRTAMESRDCVDGTMTWRSDEELGKKAR
jgi:hypothetical protein